MDEKRTNPTSEDLSNYQAVDPGDFVLNNQQAWRGSVGVSSYSGIVSPAYLVLSLTPKVQPQFADLLLRERSMVAQYLVASRGVGTIQRNLYWPHLKRATTLLPPLPEQAAIVRYLDYVDRRIRRYVIAKERLIGLLEEEKQAVINRAVTRGLDPNVPLKRSGVEWLGDVPEHWGVRRLKYWVGMNHHVLPESTAPEFRFRYLDISSVGTGTLLERPREMPFAKSPSRARRIVQEGDTIVSTVRTYLKAVLFIEGVDDDLVCSTGFAVLTPKHGTSPKFVSYFVQCNSFTDWVTANSTGTAYPAISESQLGSFHIGIPAPSEQTAIVEYLDKATAHIDAAIARARRQVELIQEYRTRLLADVVTGKLDVRAAAARLPNETDDRDPIDESGRLAENVDGSVS